MQAIRLSKRLEAIYSLIPPSGGIADVGTDHGLIPVRLALSGGEGPIYATDINPGPLSSARGLAEAHGVAERIRFCRCDGLSALKGEDISTVVIAGMGGETIASILSAAPWTRDAGRLLILQPMSKTHRLRRWLFENRYRIISEQLIRDGALYELMTVSGGEGEPFSPAELLTGRFSLIGSDPNFPARLEELIKKTENALSGLSACADPEKRKSLPIYEEALNGLVAMRERLEAEND